MGAVVVDDVGLFSHGPSVRPGATRPESGHSPSDRTRESGPGQTGRGGCHRPLPRTRTRARARDAPHPGPDEMVWGAWLGGRSFLAHPCVEVTEALERADSESRA